MENSTIELLINFINSKQSEVRVKIEYLSKKTEWNPWIRLEGKYIDIGIEPILVSSINYLEINCRKETSIGKLLAPQIIDSSNQHELFLKENNIDYSIENGIIRVTISTI